MRDSVGTTWVFSIIMIFTLIFAAFLVLALNYAKAYKIKNEMATIIEKYEGLTTTDDLNKIGSISIINDYLLNNGYKAKGYCSDEGDSYGVDDLEEGNLEEIVEGNDKKYYYCVRLEKGYLTCSTIYYITVFYDFNLPILGRFRKFEIKGQTNEVVYGRFMDSVYACDM